MENGEFRARWVVRRVVRRVVTMLSVATSTFSLIHSPLPSLAQQPTPADIFSRELPTPIASREISLRFEKLGLEQGLSQATIYDMMQDRHGFMWFSTQDGLNRYDGYEVKVYRHAPFDSTSLPDGWTMGLLEDRDGGIWVGSWGAVARMDPITEKFTVYRHDPADSTTFPNTAALRLMQDRNGILWFATWAAAGTVSRGGLVRMDPAKPGVFTQYRHDPLDDSSLSDDELRGLFEDSEGNIWVTSNNGLNRVVPSEPDESDPNKIRFERYMTGEIDPDDPNANRLYDMYERPDEPGILWIGSQRGLVRFSRSSGEVERFLPDPVGDNNLVRSVAPDPQNRTSLWVTLPGKGIARFDLKTGLFYQYGADPNDPNGLSTNATRLIYTDRSGVVWVSAQGVERFNPASVGFEYVKTGSKGTTLAGRIVWGIELGRDNTLWVSAVDDETRAAELFEIDRTSGTTVKHVHNPSDPGSMPRGFAQALLVDASGVLWFGAGGLARLHRESGKFIYFEADDSDPDRMPSTEIIDLFEDRSGFIWIAGDKGVSKWDPREPGKFVTYRHSEADPNSIADDLALGISEDQAGFILLATVKGLSRLDPLSGRATNFRHDPKDPTTLTTEALLCAHERRREPGIVWICTSAGLNRLDIETGVATHYTVEDGLPNNHIYAILEDDEGRLWMSTNNGLSRFDPETETFRNYGMEVGLQSLEFDLGAAHKGYNGEMFFGGINGVNAFFPNELIESSVPPEVRIVDLVVSGKSVKGGQNVTLDKPVPDVDQINLRYDQKDITFDFVGFHYEHPERNVFSYKLEGYNDDWIDSGHTRTASYTNLAPGEYTFRVKAANSAGVWNEEGASIRIVIDPPFWATWWFRILGFMAFAGLIYGGYAVRVRQIEARALELEGQVNERTAELKTSNAQLEQSATIVEAINQETSFRRLLTKILEEARVIPGVEKATAIVYMKDDDRFHVRASSGWDVAAMQNIRLTRREARSRYVEHADEVSEDIFVARDVADREASEQMAEFGKVASFIVLRVRVEDEVVGYLVFDNLTDPSAFDQRDVELLERLREHIQSAFIKTRILEELQTTLDNLQSTQDRLIQSEKMASLGQLTAGIAHEIKNPLNFVNNFSDVTAELATEMGEQLTSRRDQMPADLVEMFEGMIEDLKLNTKKIAEHGKRVDGIVQNMLEHSKTGDGRRVPTDINDLLEEYLVLAHHAQRAEDDGFELTIERDLDDSIGKVDIVPQDIGRVFMNLIGNAFDALREEGGWWREDGVAPTVTVSTSKTDESGSNGIEIRISDNGPGIPDQVRDKIFEPFFTTKPTGSGTGLGLSMSYDIVTKGHGGELTVESTPGEGATFIIRLPQ